MWCRMTLLSQFLYWVGSAAYWCVCVMCVCVDGGGLRGGRANYDLFVTTLFLPYFYPLLRNFSFRGEK